jgi:hypothetical protein
MRWVNYRSPPRSTLVVGKAVSTEKSKEEPQTNYSCRIGGSGLGGEFKEFHEFLDDVQILVKMKASSRDSGPSIEDSFTLSLHAKVVRALGIRADAREWFGGCGSGPHEETAQPDNPCRPSPPCCC